jgi:hypothetical protein
MRKTTIAVLGLILACIAGYILAIWWPLPSTPRAAGIPVYPHEAADLPVTDIADLVVAAIPAQDFEHLGWDDMIDNPMIRWKTDGVTERGTSATLREGLARVRIAGAPSTRIRQGRVELAWTVTLGTDGSEKFGPKWISIEPGVQPGGQCFGTLDDGCVFTAAQALAAPALTKKLVCDVSTLGGHTEAYSVMTSGKPPSLLVYMYSEGSGGSSSAIEIRPMSDKEDVCNSRLRTH